MAITIRTNNQSRFMLNWYELSDKEKTEFDYLDSDDSRDCSTFFRYRGNVYDVSQFMRVNGMDEFNGWHGYSSDSFYSGILIRLSSDGDSVTCATFK